MNFNFGGPSNYFHESVDDEQELLKEIQSIDTRIAAATQMYNNNNILITTLIQQQQENQPIHGGSIPGHIVIHRDREAADARLFEDYFGDNPLFHEGLFRRRFRMSKTLFLRILQAVEAHDNYFVQKKDGIGRLSLSSLQKITSAFRVLAYGIPIDETDEYVKIGESTVVESVKRLCRAVVEVFGGRYLRAPNAEDIERLLRTGKERGFPGMLGSLDCMHWRWKNCPTAWAGQYAGRSGHPTIILEAVADYDLWIWHVHFGMPESNNNINVLEASHLFANLTEGVAPPARYIIQGHEYTMGYYLADGIYPPWATLVQTILRNPRGTKKKYFAMRQESCRKDVERAFGVLQSRFAIVAGPVRFWSKRVLHDIMSACIIMHNMIIEDERDLGAPIRDFVEAPRPDVEMVDEQTRFDAFRRDTVKSRTRRLTTHFEKR